MTALEYSLITHPNFVWTEILHNEAKEECHILKQLALIVCSQKSTNRVSPFVAH